MEDIILYRTATCPKCKVVELKLEQARLPHTEVLDTEEMESIGIKSVPALKVGETIYDFSAAIKYLNGVIKNGND